MRKSRQISLKDCYEVLQLQTNASLEDVKKSYRRRAFELHPDLNPDNPGASKQFQLLNEAYVALSQILQKEENNSATKAQEKASQASQGKTRPGFDAAAREKYKQQRAYDAKEGARREAEARRRQEARREEERQEKLRQEKLRQEHLRQEKLRQEAEARRKAAEEAAEAARQKVEAAEREAAARQRAAEENARKNQEHTKMDEQRQRAASKAYGQEDVLRDILHDPFARRVFEDIYSEVNKQNSEKENHKSDEAHNKNFETQEDVNNKKTEASAPPPPPPEPPPPPPTAQVELLDNKTPLHMANSFSDKIKGWFKHQIDDEQTIKMPASHLFVGARIRLQIRRGLSEELSTVEIVLPPEFVVGRPLRLRGLGKKVGKWQGDLYLTIESK